MPLDFGISDMLAEEYERFTEGLLDLADGAQARARATAARRRATDPDVTQIAIPGWDSVLHIVPRPKITPEMRAAHYAARRAGQTSPLSEPLVEELERKGRQARRIQRSTSPEYAKAFGQVMTSIDNVQDLLSTVTTVGRLVLNPAVTGLEALGSRAIPLISPAARLGARGVGRVIPVLGAVLLAADLLRLVNYLGLAAFPLYAALCQGPRAALAAGVPAFLMRPALKLRAGNLSALNPFGRRARLDRSRTIRSWRPTIYNLMEVAQTTDQLFGVGVSFGGLVGLVQDAAFGAEQKLRGKDVRIDAGPFTESLHRLFAPGLRLTPTPVLADQRAAASVLATAPVLNRTQQVFTVEEHLEFLAAQSVAWSFLRPVIESPAMERAMELAMEHRWRPPQNLAPDLEQFFDEEGLERTGFGLWPLPDSPERVRGEHYFVSTAPEVTRALAELLLPIRDSALAQGLGAIVNRITERSAILLTGDADAVRLELQPVYQIMESLAEVSLWPNVEAGEGRMWSFFLACEKWLLEHHRRQVPEAVLLEEARKADVGLIRGLAPDAQFPASVLPEGI